MQEQFTPIPYAFISISGNKVAIVDADMAEEFLKHKWSSRRGYASRYIKKGEAGWVSKKENGGVGQAISLHQFVIECPKPLVTDHISGNKLDNRRSNLRCATRSQNAAWSVLNPRNTSGYRGVVRSKGRWRAQVRCHGVITYSTLTPDPSEAALAADRLAKECFGEFASLNFTQQ